jgi:hypothetical protein
MTVVPIFLASAFLLYQIHIEGRELIRRDVDATARALMVAVDRELAGAKGAAMVLATSASLQSDDLVGFRAQAMLFCGRSRETTSFSPMRRDSRSSILLDQRESRCRTTAILIWSKRFFAAGEPAISDLYVGGVRRTPVISIDVPVFITGQANIGAARRRGDGARPPERFIGMSSACPATGRWSTIFRSAFSQNGWPIS